MCESQKSCAVFGAGLSGRAAQKLALRLGYRVVLYDEKGTGDCSEFGEEDLVAFDEFVFSPGFASEHPWRVLIERSGRVALSELAFAAKRWKGPIIGITGTNGKTTLTQLLHTGLQKCGLESVAAGNIGLPFSQAVLETDNSEAVYAVLEVSSFQAELAEGLQLDALLWTNFAEDHLDRYATMSDYFSAKANLLETVKSDGVCILGRQVADTMKRYGHPLGRCQISTNELGGAFGLSDGSPFARAPYSENFRMAASLWQSLGLPSETLVAAANDFELAPHRLQLIAEYGGIRFWDDSKATNFHAALAAVESVTRPIVWIGGGSLKGGDLAEFASDIAPKVDAVCLYGEAGMRLLPHLQRRSSQVFYAEQFEDAVRAAVAEAKTFSEGSVLLSPGFASFGQFASYAARGKSFVDTVLSLKND